MSGRRAKFLRRYAAEKLGRSPTKGEQRAVKRAWKRGARG